MFIYGISPDLINNVMAMKVQYITGSTQRYGHVCVNSPILHINNQSRIAAYTITHFKYKRHVSSFVYVASPDLIKKLVSGLMNCTVTVDLCQAGPMVIHLNVYLTQN